MTALWAWVALTIGPWVMLVTFGLVAVALLVLTVAMVEATRRQPTVATALVGVVLVLVLLGLAVGSAAIAWAAGLSVILGR